MVSPELLEIMLMFLSCGQTMSSFRMVFITATSLAFENMCWDLKKQIHTNVSQPTSAKTLKCAFMVLKYLLKYGN